MLFYKVVIGNVRDRKTGYETVKNELITEKELQKHFPIVPIDCFRIVNVSKKKTYWFFGARFERGQGFNS